MSLRAPPVAQEDFSDIGGLDKQISELIEAVVLPMTQAERFKAVGVDPPKGVLLYGPPGTGKTLMCAAAAAGGGCGVAWVSVCMFAWL